MINDGLKNRLADIARGGLFFDEPLSRHSTIKIGGPADVLVTPEDVDTILNILRFAREEEIETFFLGAGSNVLFRDGGFEGIVISTKKFSRFKVLSQDEHGVRLDAESGVYINDLVNWSIHEGLAGFEMLAGIPGTIGGALTMNAGTHDGSISDSLYQVMAVDRAGRMYEWPKKKIGFSYRRAKYPRAAFIISSEFNLMKSEGADLEKKADELRERRKTRHPLSWPSLGSIFMNPKRGQSAGELIEEAGLKGVRVGGARISNEHGNWIVNENKATAKDIEILIHLAREKVRETADVSLETEIVIIGRK